MRKEELFAEIKSGTVKSGDTVTITMKLNLEVAGASEDGDLVLFDKESEDVIICWDDVNGLMGLKDEYLDFEWRPADDPS